MKKLGGVLVVLAIVVVGVGFYRGWFTLTVDRDKMQEDAGLLVSGRVTAPAAEESTRKTEDDAITNELKKLGGAWTVFASDWSDAKDKDRGKGLKCMLTGARVVIKSPGEDKIIGGFIIKIDPAKKPKTINVWSDESSFGKSIEDTLKEPPVLGIYELDGDTLKICWVALENRSRPDTFPAKRGSGDTVIIMKRDKKA